MSIYEVIERINFPLPTRSELIISGFSCYEDIIEDHNDTLKLKSLFVYMKSRILKKSKTTRKLLIDYLNILINGRRNIAIIDVGWSGSSQVPINSFFNNYFDGVSVIGYYFALIDSETLRNRMKTQKMKYFICGPYINHKLSNEIYINRALIEMLFSAPHQSIIDYTKKGNEILPFFGIERGATVDYSAIFNEINEGISDFFSEVDFDIPNIINRKDVIEKFINELNNLNIKLHPLFKNLINIDAWGSTINRKYHFKDLI